MNNSNRKKYIYNGEVTSFGNEVCKHWKGETIAVSEKAARNNLMFQFKKSFGKKPTFTIELPDEIIEVGVYK